MLASKFGGRDFRVYHRQRTDHRAFSGSIDTRKQTSRRTERQDRALMIICSPTFRCIRTKKKVAFQHESIPQHVHSTRMIRTSAVVKGRLSGTMPLPSCTSPLPPFFPRPVRWSRSSNALGSGMGERSRQEGRPDSLAIPAESFGLVASEILPKPETPRKVRRKARSRSNSELCFNPRSGRELRTGQEWM
jgi:hypothetical protein